MAIKIVLKRQQAYFTLLEEFNTRTEIALEALQQIMIGEIFQPTRLVGWINAPMEELGGQRVGEFPLGLERIGHAHQVRPLIVQLTYKMKNELTSSSFGHSIFRIEGMWNINGVKTEGFLSINNDPDWKSAYGDVDIDGYPVGKYDDFLDLLWDNEQIRDELINRLLSDFTGRVASNGALTTILGVKWISFANGVPSHYELRDMKAVYYDGLRTLVEDLTLTFSERRRKEVQRSMSKTYVVHRHLKSHKFQQQVQQIIVQSNVKVRKGSLIMVAGEKQSFANLYDKFEQLYLKPLYHKVKVDQQVNRAIEENIELAQAQFDRIDPVDDLFGIREDTDSDDESSE